MSESVVSLVLQGEEIREFSLEKDGGPALSVCIRLAGEMGLEQYPSSTWREDALIVSPVVICFFLFLVLPCVVQEAWIRTHLGGIMLVHLAVMLSAMGFLLVKVEERRTKWHFGRQSTAKPYLAFAEAVKHRNECVRMACQIKELHERLLKKRPSGSSLTIYDLKRETCLENARVLNHRFRQVLKDVQCHARLTKDGELVMLPHEVEVSILKFAKDMRSHLAEIRAEAPTLEES